MLIIGGVVAVCLGFFLREILRAPLIETDAAPEANEDLDRNEDGATAPQDRGVRQQDEAGLRGPGTSRPIDTNRLSVVAFAAAALVRAAEQAL